MPPLFPDGPSQPQQRVLDLGHDVASGRADFLVSPANEAAFSWMERWPDWPAYALALAGPSGSGKSHLSRIWGIRTGAIDIDAAGLSVSALPAYLESDRPSILEGGQARAGNPEFEEALFHLYNAMRSARRSLLIVDIDPPARWPVKLHDLASRLATIPVATIELPDDSLLGALFYKLFADRQLQVSPDIVSFIVARMERSFDAAHDIVENLDRTALARKSPITLATARAVLAAREIRG